MMRACSAFHVVEQIRQGIEPGEALERALDRIRKDPKLKPDMQCGLMAIRADGSSGKGAASGFRRISSIEGS